MACEQVDYEVQSSSGDDDEGERGEEREQEVWSGGQGESEERSSEDEEIERQRRLAVTEKEKVVLPPLYLYTCIRMYITAGRIWGEFIPLPEMVLPTHPLLN